jgi:hypothetical protein
MSVFISYARVDKLFVEKLISELDQLGVEYFLDEKDIEWGGNVAETIADAVKSCSSVLVIVSPASLKSAWVPYEIGQAKALGKAVLPLLTHPSLELPGYLHSLNYKTDLQEALRYFTSESSPTKVNLKGIHETLRQGESLSGAQRIDLIRQLANGPRKAAQRHLEEIAGNQDFYSRAETAAALAALQNLSEGKPNYDLMEKVEAQNPVNKAPDGATSLALAFMFWERPGSKFHKGAFDALLKMANGETKKEPPMSNREHG